MHFAVRRGVEGVKYQHNLFIGRHSMNKWLLAGVLVLGAHFGASYLVPLDQKAQQTFGGLLRWAWPWADGDSGPLGEMTVASGFPISGFFIAVTSAGLFALAAFAAMGIWLPFNSWRWWAMAGATRLYS